MCDEPSSSSVLGELGTLADGLISFVISNAVPATIALGLVAGTIWLLANIVMVSIVVGGILVVSTAITTLLVRFLFKRHTIVYWNTGRANVAPVALSPTRANMVRQSHLKALEGHVVPAIEPARTALPRGWSATAPEPSYVCVVPGCITDHKAEDARNRKLAAAWEAQTWKS
jgi:hypothetical protein